MKHIAAAVTLIIASTATAQLNIGLKAHWTFGGGTNDVSGNAHDGTIEGPVQATTDRAGNPNCAFAFPGDSTHISIPFHTDFDIAPSAAYTISLWYQGGTPEAGDLEWLYKKQNTPQLYHSWNYGLTLYDLNRALYFCGDDQQMWSAVTPPMPDTQWHNLVGIYSNGTHQLWLDNVLVASDNSMTYFVTQSLEGSMIGEGFGGSIDDIRFYDRAVSTAEVALLFNEASACATGVAEITVPEITVAPNPATDVITVRFDGAAGSHLRNVELIDATGRAVRSMYLRGSLATMDVRQLPSGLYFLSLGKGAMVKKVIKD